MNVIVTNEHQNELANLDIDIIKSITGVYDAKEIVEMFKNFFYNKMILDVTALKSFDDIQTYEQLVAGLDATKIVFLLPEGSKLCTPNFLGQLISLGIYNFTTNMKGVSFLIKKSNSFQDVEHILKMSNSYHNELDSMNDVDASSLNSKKGISKVEEVDRSDVSHKARIIGFSDVTTHAGATTLIFMLKKELSYYFGRDKVLALELNRNDFIFFNDSSMLSIKDDQVLSTIEKHSDVEFVLVDLNNCSDFSFCDEVIYLVEPTTIKLNKLIRRKRDIFSELVNKTVVLNKSSLLNNDVSDFEKEAGIKVFYNMQSLDERKKNAIITDFLIKMGILKNNEGSNNGNKIFGLFRR